ncbi:hypothetical protein tinsulaeT_25610 [Thalassotalea insulae]|uniref:DUF4154 domain-containing protein n=1 Tax=Thalassotalea insulae TaxID=2056778 RepID=A0ABQ6GYE5_9GAMM|nr:YfiR/HmsC family protein [Thalassotalea insulae]GLX79221.1 hypothetical protein tinsulaeT_25610 [Thalassotalea insulae]
MITSSKHFLATLFLFSALAVNNCTAEELPIRLQVALMSKIVAMEHNLATKQKISIFVLGAPKVFELLQQDIGFQMGNSKLVAVDQGDRPPEKQYDVIYIGAFAENKQAMAYAKRYNVMSLYPKIAGKTQIGSLGLGIKSGKPTFYLDLEQSEAENLHWNAKIIKLAQLK